MNFIPVEFTIPPSLTKTKVYLIFLYTILFGVLLFPEAKKVSETIIWVNIFMLLPTFIFVNWEERLSKLMMPVVFVRAVMIQTMMQMVIYLYWGQYNPAVIDRLPLLVHQVAFGYLFQFNLCMFSEKKCAFSFSTAAAIVSANLFIWFSHKVYFFHYLLISSAIILKMLLTRKVNGVDRHIFNPSGLVSFIAVSVIMLYPFSDYFSDYYFGPQIGAFWLWVPHFDLVVLLCSCVTLWTPNLYIIPLSCVSFFVFGDVLTRIYLNKDLIEESGRGAVFLGIAFLITDPSTAPKTRFGQILYGVSYGLSVCLAFSYLVAHGGLLYFKKVLFIVIVNLMTPYFDSAGLFLQKIFFRTSRFMENLSRAKWLAIYMLFFLFVFNYFQRGTMPPYFFDFTDIMSHRPLPPEAREQMQRFLVEHPRKDVLADFHIGYGFGQRIFDDHPHPEPSFSDGMGVVDYNLYFMRIKDKFQRFYQGILGEFNRKEYCQIPPEERFQLGIFNPDSQCVYPPSPFKKNPDFERY